MFKLDYESFKYIFGFVTHLLMLNIKGEVELYIGRKLYVVFVSCYFNASHCEVYVRCKLQKSQQYINYYILNSSN